MPELKATVVFKKNWEALHNPDVRVIMNIGSSRSSKSISVLDCADLYCRAYKNKRVLIWRNTKADCIKTTLVDFKQHLKNTDRWLVNHTFSETTANLKYNTGSTIEFFGFEDSGDSVFGLQSSILVLEECYTMPKEVWQQISMRNSEKIFVMFNPKQTSIFDDIAKMDTTLVIHSTFRENPFCPPEQKKMILSYQTVAQADPNNLEEVERCKVNEFNNTADKRKWDIFGLGLPSARENLIYSGWTRIPDSQFDEVDAEILYGIDFGISDKTSIIKTKFKDGCYYIHQLLHESENEMADRYKSTEDVLVRAMREVGVPIDALIVCDNIPQRIMFLREHGYEMAVAVKKGPGSIVSGIGLVQSVKVFYTYSSADIEKEYQEYSWKLDKFNVPIEEPEGGMDHGLDNLRYSLTYRLME